MGENIFTCTKRRPSRSELCNGLPVPESPRSPDSYHPSEDEKNPKQKPVTSHNYSLRKRLSKSSSDEEERFYNLRSQGPVPDPDPETPVEKTIHETEPESESDTEETTTKMMLSLNFKFVWHIFHPRVYI